MLYVILNQKSLFVFIQVTMENHLARMNMTRNIGRSRQVQSVTQKDESADIPFQWFKKRKGSQNPISRPAAGRMMTRRGTSVNTVADNNFLNQVINFDQLLNNRPDKIKEGTATQNITSQLFSPKQNEQVMRIMAKRLQDGSEEKVNAQHIASLRLDAKRMSITQRQNSVLQGGQEESQFARKRSSSSIAATNALTNMAAMTGQQWYQKHQGHGTRGRQQNISPMFQSYAKSMAEQHTSKLQSKNYSPDKNMNPVNPMYTSQVITKARVSAHQQFQQYDKNSSTPLILEPRCLSRESPVKQLKQFKANVGTYFTSRLENKTDENGKKDVMMARKSISDLGSIANEGDNSANLGAAVSRLKQKSSLRMNRTILQRKVSREISIESIKLEAEPKRSIKYKTENKFRGSQHARASTEMAIRNDWPIAISPDKDKAKMQSTSIDSSEQPQTLKELLQDMNSKHSVERAKQILLDQRMLKGRSQYQIPDKKYLKKISDGFIDIDQDQLLQQLTGYERSSQGIVTLNSMYERQKLKDVREQKKDKMHDYVTHFSQIAELLEHTAGNDDSETVNPNVVIGFAKGVREKVQMNRIKSLLKDTLVHNIRQNKERQTFDNTPAETSNASLQAATVGKRDHVFNKTLEEETKQMSFIADKLIQKKEYQQKFKEIQKYHDQEDPKIQFYQKCNKMQDMALPILDKIWKKTLCLQSYLLSDGNIRGLAKACEVLDFRLVNRLLLANNGINGDQLAEIITGMAKLREFKSLIYKQNGLNQNSLMAMRPVFEKRLPLQLEELKLIDCKILPKHIIELMGNLLELSQLKRLALVGVKHSNESFQKVVTYVDLSQSLEEIDLSNNVVPKGSWVKLANVLQENRTLRSLSLSFNCLLEDQSWRIPVALENQEQANEAVLSPNNQQLMDGFRDFIKYNPMLFHLDLQTVGLPAQIIRLIGHIMTRAISLQAIHLCGNEGISEEMIEWLRKRIRAKDAIASPTIIPHQKKYFTQPKQETQAPPTQKSALMSMLLRKKPVVQNDPNKEWKELRAGLKLQSIVNSKRMTEIHATKSLLLNKRKCIITRHLGYKDVIQKSGQWQISTDVRDECWFCGQHVLALFLWAPRIGQLSQVRDPDNSIRKHYQEQFTALEADEEFMPKFYQTPHFRSYFTNWRNRPMREVLSFCKQHDQNAPDFIPKLILDGMIRQACSEPKARLNEPEKRLIDHELDRYYEEHWTHVIISIMKMKNPLVANAHIISSLSLQVDQSHPLYFDVDWVKPGRHVFTVEHDQGGAILDDDDQYGQRLQSFMQKKMSSGLKSGAQQQQQQSFYVHEMLAGLRNDPIPVAYKSVYTKTMTRSMFKPKPVFESWKHDDHEVLRRCLDYDMKMILTDDITGGDQTVANSLLKLVSRSFASLKEIFHYLQGTSTQYPRIDRKTLTEKFIKELTIDTRAINMNMVEILVTTIQQAEMRKQRIVEKATGKRIAQGFNRHMYLELVFRLAKFLYSTEPIVGRSPKKIAENITKVDSDIIDVSQAFELFFKGVINPFLANVDINWQAFRDQKLNDSNVELVFTMNMPGIELCYKQYCKKLGVPSSPLKRSSTPDEDMSVHDCIKLFMKDSKLKVPSDMVKQAYSMSKMTVVNDVDAEGIKQYSQLTKVEFLEFLSRIADLFFNESEMEDLQLYEKIEFVLDEILPLVGARRVKQNITVEEFSESDGDY